jgi:MFS family permease
MSGIAASAVVVAFDATIVSTSLPQVAQALDGIEVYAWVGTGYFLASAVSIMIFGRLGDLFGRKPLLMTALAIVTIASVLCGVAQTMGQLICFRVFQGLGGGMMMATAFAAPADLFPDPRVRVRWMVLISSSFAVASGLTTFVLLQTVERSRLVESLIITVASVAVVMLVFGRLLGMNLPRGPWGW